MEKIKSKVSDEISGAEKTFRELALFIHSNPELGYQERKSSDAIRKVLRDAGFKIEENLIDMNTAFRAEAPNCGGGAKIAFLAEYDALPALGHACGHNLIATAAVAASVAVSRVYEKIPAKYSASARRGRRRRRQNSHGPQRRLRRLDAVMMVHPSNRNQCVKKALGVVTVNVKFIGKSSHASAHPEGGINALDAMILFFSASTRCGSTSENTNAFTASSRTAATLPTSSRPDGSDAARPRADRYGNRKKSEARRRHRPWRGARHRLLVRIRSAHGYGLRAFHPNRKLAEIFRANMESLGVLDSRAGETEGMGSSDIGNVGRVAPTIHPEYEIGGIGVVNHTPEFAKASATDDAIAVTLKWPGNGYDRDRFAGNKNLVEAVASEFKSGN